MPAKPNVRQGDAATEFAICVAAILNVPVSDLPSESKGEWKAQLRVWLARRGLGLVQLANPGDFSWPGYWIAIVRQVDNQTDVAVLMFGSPSGVILSRAAERLVGRAARDLSITEGYVISAFEPVREIVAQDSRTAGAVVGLFVASKATGPMRAVDEASAIAGRGLEGDRYAAKAGTFTPASPALKGYDLSLIESEVLDSLSLPDGTRVSYGEARRNVVTRGMNLNAMVGRRFKIGDIECFGQRLCEPCSHLERLTKPGVLKLLIHRGGLRADVLTDGRMKVGDPIHA